MTQQINLLQKPASLPTATRLGGYGLLIVLAVLIALGLRDQMQISALKTELQTQEQVLQAAKTELRAKRLAAGLPDTESDAITVSALQTKLKQKAGLQDLTQKGEFGKSGGHSAVMTAIATVSEPGVWLREISTQQAGKKLALSGYALSGDAVTRYFNQLNQALRPLNISLTSADLAIEEGGVDGAKQKQMTLQFKLY